MYQTGESRIHFPVASNDEVDFIEIEFGAIDYRRYYISGVNIETKLPIIKPLEGAESPEQKRIRELEDLLLLATDIESGGIL